MSELAMRLMCRSKPMMFSTSLSFVDDLCSRSEQIAEIVNYARAQGHAQLLIEYSLVHQSQEFLSEVKKTMEEILVNISCKGEVFGVEVKQVKGALFMVKISCSTKERARPASAP